MVTMDVSGVVVRCATTSDATVIAPEVDVMRLVR
jgi:hypothetical protein